MGKKRGSSQEETPKKSISRKRSSSATRALHSNEMEKDKQIDKKDKRSSKSKPKGKKSLNKDEDMMPIKVARKDKGEKITKARIQEGEDAIEMEVRESEIRREFPMEGEEGEEGETADEINGDDSSDEDNEVEFNQQNNNATRSREEDDLNKPIEPSCSYASEDVDLRKDSQESEQQKEDGEIDAKEEDEQSKFEDALARCLAKPSTKLLKVMEKKGFVRAGTATEDRNDHQGQKERYKEKGASKGKNDNASMSEITVYKGAVRVELDEQSNMDKAGKRISSSSDEPIDTSDEFADVGTDEFNRQNIDIVSQHIENKISDLRRNNGHGSRERDEHDDMQMTGERRAEDLIRRAEASKAKMYNVPGNVEIVDKFKKFGMGAELIHSVLVDEQYSMVAAHVDQTTRNRIVEGKYVDFVRLLPRDRLADENGDDTRQMYMRNGQPVWMTAEERSMEKAIEKEGLTISNFGKWEQAFRVFTNIYTEAFPSRAKQLTQYSHVIHSAAMTFVWSNVYAYDKDFRIHLSEFPDRSWGVILQQAWNMRLREKLVFSSSSGERNFERKRNVCYRFNRGNCSYGLKCKFEHKCAFCSKFGHGSFNCRKAKGNGNGQNQHNFERGNDRVREWSDKETGERGHNGDDRRRSNYYRK